MVRVLGLGDNTVDTYVDQGMQYPGGNAVLARRCGAAASYLGCLGDDEAGGLIAAALVAEGVDPTRVRRVAAANARARIGHRDGDRVFLGSSPGCRGAYGGFDTADLAYIAAHDLVHSSVYSEIEAELPRIRGEARLLSFDFSERWTPEMLARVLPLLDVAFLSAPRLSDVDCATLLADCAARGPGLVVATRGAAGALAWGEGRVWRQAALPAKVVDTLGAGDGFIAALLVARLRGASIADVLQAGARMAAQVCGWRGAFGHGTVWTPTAETPA